MPRPSQNIASASPACMNPGISRASEISTVSIAAMLAVSPTIVTFAARLNGIVLSIGTMIKVYPTANASVTASMMVEVMPQPSKKPIAAPAASPMLHPIKHLRACLRSPTLGCCHDGCARFRDDDFVLASTMCNAGAYIARVVYNCKTVTLY